MKPAAFEYHRPGSIEEALALMAEYGDEAKPLAGGQSLLPLLAMRLAAPAHLVDLNQIAELAHVWVEGPLLCIGAMVRQGDLEHDPRTPPVVAAALPHIGHFQIRNRGTVGGSLAHMDPAAEWPALALVTNAVLVAASKDGRREIRADEFSQGPLMTVLAPDELLLEVRLPLTQAAFGFAEVARTSGAFALAGAVCHAGAIAVFGTGSRPQRLARVESMMAAGLPAADDVQAAAHDEIEALDDVHATASYRRRVGAALVARVVAEASASEAQP